MSEEDKTKTNNEKVTINDYYYYYLLKCEDALNKLEKELEDRIKNVPYTMAEVYEDISLLDKLQELKGSGKE